MRRSVVVSTLGITQTLAWRSTYYLAAVFADPISDTLQLPRVWFFGIFSASLLLSGLLGPSAGRMIDKHCGRDVLAATNLVFAAGLVCLSFASGIFSLTFAWALIGIGMGFGLLIEGGTDRGSIGLGDDEHPKSMSVHTTAGKCRALPD
jgi:MFS family permease